MRKLFFFFGLMSFLQMNAQDIHTARQIVDTLTAETFWGRGYTRDGMEKAATYISEKFKTLGLQPMKGNSYFQLFTYPVNTFPGKMELSVNGKELVPGKDFIVSAESAGIKGSGKLEQADSIQFLNQKDRLILRIQDKLTWSVSTSAADYSMLDVKRTAISGIPENYTINIQNKFQRAFTARNVCAVQKGTRYPDSVIMITAHYDHLGGMGNETYFPGANDNASGIALLLNLAQYYALHPPEFTIAFICFAGEEAGLIGSKYFTENPLLPLKHIRFLLNTDLAGTGQDGITVVNATEFPKEFAWLNEINDKHHYLKAINARGKAPNSDHYFFTEKSVPSFFFYTLGGISAYHDVDDVAATLPLTEHEDLLQLVIKFNEKLMTH